MPIKTLRRYFGHVLNSRGTKMEEATITFFGNRGFGFARTPSGEDVFIHSRRWRRLLPNGRDFEPFYFLYSPEPGMAIWFERDDRPSIHSRAAASNWALIENERFLEWVSQTHPFYRVVWHRTWCGNLRGDPEILWEGWCLDELSRIYPRDWQDELETPPPSESFSWTCWFENKLPDGEWAKVSDPRPHVSGYRKK